MRKRSIQNAKLVAFMLESRHDRELRMMAAADKRTFSWELREAVRDYLKRRGRLL